MHDIHESACIYGIHELSGMQARGDFHDIHDTNEPNDIHNAHDSLDIHDTHDLHGAWLGGSSLCSDAWTVMDVIDATGDIDVMHASLGTKAVDITSVMGAMDVMGIIDTNGDMLHTQ